MKFALKYKLIVIGLAMFSTESAWAAYCSNLAVKYTIPATFDVTGKAVGSKLYSLESASVSGTCKRDSSMNGSYLYITNTRSLGGSGMCLTSNAQTSNDGYLRITATSIACSSAWTIASDYLTSGTGSFAVKPINNATDAGIVTLNKIPPAGKTTINNPLFFLTPGNYYSRIGGTTTGAQENVNVSVNTSQITLINKVSCGVSVNDVNFGDRTITALKSGGIPEDYITLKFVCNNQVPNKGYSLSFQGQDGVHNINSGILKVKNNTTVGYQLTWAVPIFAPTNSPVVLDNKPIQNTGIFINNSFSIPIKVKPVVLTSPVKAGPINTSLIINIKLN